MKYQVIARKFRPQLFTEVVGQEPIVRTLQNAIEMGRTGHAYLFSGPRGVGKTTTARLLAKALNCSVGPTPAPCNTCSSCVEISAGRSIDVLEIDAASNTGVDSIRELRENARYAPSRDRFKIFIVDEVHMLSTAAFNALLKILEEPPPHIVFILATTERHKLPGTILSRCQQFVFRTIPAFEIRAHLEAIAVRENVNVGQGALGYIVKAAEGSMRDAQSLLDQVIAFGGQTIADEDVREVLGFIPTELINRAAEALVSREPRGMLEVIEIVVDQGMSMQQFVREFLGRIRDMLLAKLGLGDRILGTAEDRAIIQETSARASEQDLIRYMDVLLRLENDIRWTSEARFHVEVACVKLAKLGRLRDLEDVLRELGPEAGSGAAPPAAVDATSGVASQGEEGPARAQTAVASESGRLQSRPPLSEAPPPPRREPAPPEAGPAGQSGAPRLPADPASGPTHGDREDDAPPPPSRMTSGAPQSGRRGAALRESVQNESLVQSFLDVFKGEIAHVRSADETEGDAP